MLVFWLEVFIINLGQNVGSSERSVYSNTDYNQHLKILASSQLLLLLSQYRPLKLLQALLARRWTCRNNRNHSHDYARISPGTQHPTRRRVLRKCLVLFNLGSFLFVARKIHWLGWHTRQKCQGNTEYWNHKNHAGLPVAPHLLVGKLRADSEGDLARW